MTLPHFPPLHLRTERLVTGAVVIRVAGELDHETAPDLLDAVTGELAAQPPPGGLELDLSGVAVCDSSGLSALIVALRRATGAGTGLRLTGLPTQLVRVIRVTGLAAHFDGAADTAGLPSAPRSPTAPDGGT
ncbi:STAS domain-containing protein [Streptomyces sp. NPDC002574]|uniref:STAS domain-containing protein n=1 Tax=Streptomyces sp. NPDC002574 TaxID=3364652 RepID=UPI0036BB0677